MYALKEITFAPWSAVSSLLSGDAGYWLVSTVFASPSDCNRGLAKWSQWKGARASAGHGRDEGKIPESEDPLEEGMAAHSSVLA